MNLRFQFLEGGDKNSLHLFCLFEVFLSYHPSSLFPLPSSFSLNVMNLRALIQQLWQRFVSLLKISPVPAPDLLFERIKEAGDWRTGTGLWSGTLPLFSARVYYLEVSRTSYADRRELGIKPPPTHTFKVYYFTSISSGSVSQKQRVTVFVAYQNCYMQGNSEDCIAVEVIGKAIERRLKVLCETSNTDNSNTFKTETIKRPGELPQIRIIEKNKGLPAVTLLGRASAQTTADWQEFVDEEMKHQFDKRAERIKDKGIGFG